MVAAVAGLGELWCRPVGQLEAEVVVLEHLAELLSAPLLDEELEASACAQAAVAVVAEDADDAGPDVRHLLGGHEGAEANAEEGVDAEAAAHPQVVADAELGVFDGAQRDVLHLVEDVRDPSCR